MPGPTCLYRFDDNRRKVMGYCIIMSKTGFVIPFFQHTAPPMRSLGLFFSQTSSQPGFSVMAQSQDPAGSSALHQPPSQSLSPFFNYLFKTRLFAHIKLAPGGCSIFNMPLLPSRRWPHLHEVKDTNLKNTK